MSVSSHVARKFKQLLYRLGWVTPFNRIDRNRYLRRLKRARFNDSRYVSSQDRAQFVGSEVVVRVQDRGISSYFHCQPRSSIEGLILRYGFFQKTVFDTLISYIRPGTCVLDIGTNIGAYAIPLARAFPDIEIHGFEPNPLMVARLKENLALNQLIDRNIKIMPMGLSETRGHMTLYAVSSIEGNPGLSSMHKESLGDEKHSTIEVAVETLDALYLDAPRPVDVIKLDVQGHELAVLRGGRKMLNKFRPVLVFEHEDHLFSSASDAQDAKTAIGGFLDDLGYRCYYISHYGADLLTRVAWQQPLNGDVLAIPFPADA